MHGKENFDAHRPTAMRSSATALVTALGLAWAGPAIAGKVVNIDPPGAEAAFAYSINDAGAVVGTYVDADGTHGFIRAPGGTYTTFNRLNHGTAALSINRKGQIAGYYRADFVDHGCLRLKGGKLRLFDLPGALRVEPWGINNDGMIGGFYEDDVHYKEHGFVRAADGTVTTFDPSGADGTFVWSINAAGTTAGWYEDGGGQFYGFTRGADGTIRNFEVSGSETWPTGINDSGTVTGCYDNGTKCSGFVRSADGTTASFDAQNASKTAPEAINARGVITGTADETHGFVRYPSGKIATFDAPNATHTYAWGINKDGAIVGYYLDANEVVHAFLRTP